MSRPQRSRKATQPAPGTISTDSTFFEATLDAETQVLLTPSSPGSLPPSPGGLSSLIPSTQAINVMSHRDDDEFEDEEGDEHQHNRTAASASTNKRKQEAEVVDSDDEKPVAAAAAAASPHAQTPSKKLGKWNMKEDADLCSSVLAHVTSHKGMLPGPVKAGKNAVISEAWKEIAKACTKTSGLTADAGAKACSNRWCKLRTDLKDHLEVLRSAFEIELKEEYASGVKSALAIDESEEMSSDQKKTVSSSVKKKLGEVMSHMRIVKNASYAFIQWDPDYKRTADEEKVWKKVCASNKDLLAVVDAVGEVFTKVGLQVDEASAAAAAGDEDDEQQIESEGGTPNKRARRVSAGGATDRAMSGFAQVMSAFLPPPPPPAPTKLTWTEWAKKCALTDEQKTAVLNCLPDPSIVPEPELLACFETDELRDTCKLKSMQLACWAKLAAKASE